MQGNKLVNLSPAGIASLADELDGQESAQIDIALSAVRDAARAEAEKELAALRDRLALTRETLGEADRERTLLRERYIQRAEEVRQLREALEQIRDDMSPVLSRGESAPRIAWAALAATEPSHG